MKNIFFISVAFISLGLSVSAQSLSPEVIVTAGDHYNNTQGSVSWTLGEISTETYTSANNMLTQGFQQPHIIVTGLQEELSSDKFNIYPNPVKDLLYIDMNTLSAGTYIVELFDAGGKLVSKTVQEKGNTQQQVTVGLKNIANGTYFLNVININANRKTVYQINKSE